MGKKKAKEPETPAKDEVSNFAEKSTENLPIESFLTMKLTFWSCGKPSRSFDDLFIHDKKNALDHWDSAFNHFSNLLSSSWTAKQNSSV